MSILTISGCANIQGHYYIRNLTDYPAVVRAVIDDEDLTTDYFTAPALGSTWSIPYTESIINVNFESLNGFTNSVKVNPIDMARLEFTIPPKSTLFLGYGHNQKFINGFDQCVIAVNGREISISTQDITQMNLKREGRKKYIGCFDIK